MQFLEKDNSDFIDESLLNGFHLSLSVWISIIVAFTGVGIAAVVYSRFKSRLGATIQFFYQAFYINQLYTTLALYGPCAPCSKSYLSLFLSPKFLIQACRWQLTIQH